MNLDPVAQARIKKMGFSPKYTFQMCVFIFFRTPETYFSNMILTKLKS